MTPPRLDELIDEAEGGSARAAQELRSLCQLGLRACGVGDLARVARVLAASGVRPAYPRDEPSIENVERWLLAGGWARHPSGLNAWVDPDGGAVMSLADAEIEQRNREAKPREGD